MNTYPGGDFAHLVLGCVNAQSGDRVTLKLANNRSYAQILVPQSGLQVSSIDHVDNGGVNDTLSSALRDLFKATGVYVPANAEATLVVSVQQGTTGSLDVRTSQLALAMDAASRLLDVILLDPKQSGPAAQSDQASALKCIYTLMSGSPTPPLRDLVKITMDCATPFVKGLAKLLLGPVRLYAENQFQQQMSQIDGAINKVLGGGESVQVQVAAPPAPAEPYPKCGTVKAVTGSVDVIRTRGNAPCSEGVSVADSYYKRAPSEVQGSAGVVQVGEWVCASSSGGTFQSTGYAGGCDRRRDNASFEMWDPGRFSGKPYF